MSQERADVARPGRDGNLGMCSIHRSGAGKHKAGGRLCGTRTSILHLRRQINIYDKILA